VDKSHIKTLYLLVAEERMLEIKSQITVHKFSSILDLLMQAGTDTE
jgi:hypothetical protein